MQLGEFFYQGWDFLLIYIKHALYKISLSLEWYEHIPTFNEHKIAQHVWDFMNFMKDINISHEDVMIWLFPFTLK